jgi:cytochrome b561
MSTPSSVTGYSALQIILHWMIFVLIAFQLIAGESMGEAFDAMEDGAVPSAEATFNANLHIYAGVAILILAALRLFIRITRGAPGAPEGTSPLQHRIAASVHHLFYLLLFLVPISGLVAWYVYPQAADVHGFAKPAFIALILLHVAGALYNQFIQKNGVLRRIFVPGN